MTSPVSSKNLIQPIQEKVKDYETMKTIRIGLCIILLSGVAVKLGVALSRWQEQARSKAIFDAISKHDANRIKDHLKSPEFQPNAKNKHEQSYLRYAVSYYLHLKTGDQSKEAMKKAVIELKDVIQILCEEPRININDGGCLCDVCEKAPELIEFFLKRRDLHDPTKFHSKTPLWIAVNAQNVSLIKKLFQKKKYSEYRYSGQTPSGQTPLEYSVENNLVQAAKALRELGACETFKTLINIIENKNIDLLKTVQNVSEWIKEESELWKKAIENKDMLKELHRLKIVPIFPIKEALMGNCPVDVLEFLLDELKMDFIYGININISLLVYCVREKLDLKYINKLLELGASDASKAFKEALIWRNIHAARRLFELKKSEKKVTNEFFNLCNRVGKDFQDLAREMLEEDLVINFSADRLWLFAYMEDKSLLKLLLDEKKIPIKDGDDLDQALKEAVDAIYRQMIEKPENSDELYKTISYLNTKIQDPHDDNPWQWVCRNGFVHWGNKLFRDNYQFDDAVSDDGKTLLQLVENAKIDPKDLQAKETFITKLKAATSQPDRTAMPRNGGIGDLRSNY